MILHALLISKKLFKRPPRLRNIFLCRLVFRSIPPILPTLSIVQSCNPPAIRSATNLICFGRPRTSKVVGKFQSSGPAVLLSSNPPRGDGGMRVAIESSGVDFRSFSVSKPSSGGYFFGVFLKTAIFSKSCSHCSGSTILKGRALPKSVPRATPNGDGVENR